jgi:hypothetical protein
MPLRLEQLPRDDAGAENPQEESEPMTPMYAMSVPIYVKTLGSLSTILDKAAAHAEGRKIDPAVLLAARLFPDMFPLTRQVQLASDFAKGSVSRLVGREPPKYEDNETTIAQLKDRIARTIELLRGFSESDLAGAESREVVLKIRDQVHTYQGLQYLSHVALPNFFFHATTAYDILRHNGVELGKRDFIGSV